MPILHSPGSREALRVIEATDPDAGWDWPTEADYAAHKSWAIATYGQPIWNIYVAGAYGDTREV